MLEFACAELVPGLRGLAYYLFASAVSKLP